MEKKQEKKLAYEAPAISSMKVEMEEGIAAGSSSGGALRTGEDSSEPEHKDL
jgi:hypothetical protein